MKMQAERKIQVLEKENNELKEEVEQLKTKCGQLEVKHTEILKQLFTVLNINTRISVNTSSVINTGVMLKCYFKSLDCERTRESEIQSAHNYLLLLIFYF